MGFIPRPHQVEFNLERLDLWSAIWKLMGHHDLTGRFDSGQAMRTNGPPGRKSSADARTMEIIRLMVSSMRHHDLVIPPARECQDDPDSVASVTEPVLTNVNKRIVFGLVSMTVCIRQGDEIDHMISGFHPTCHCSLQTGHGRAEHRQAVSAGLS
jgi:hypothetical protein